MISRYQVFFDFFAGTKITTVYRPIFCKFWKKYIKFTIYNGARNTGIFGLFVPKLQ